MMGTRDGRYIYENNPELLALNRAIMAEREKPEAHGPQLDRGKRTPSHLVEHGTPAALQRHHRRREPACEACKMAQREARRSRLARKLGSQVEESRPDALARTPGAG